MFPRFIRVRLLRLLYKVLVIRRFILCCFPGRT